MIDRSQPSHARRIIGRASSQDNFVQERILSNLEKNLLFSYITSHSIRIVLLSRYVNIYDTLAPMSTQCFLFILYLGQLSCNRPTRSAKLYPRVCFYQCVKLRLQRGKRSSVLMRQVTSELQHCTWKPTSSTQLILWPTTQSESSLRQSLTSRSGVLMRRIATPRGSATPTAPVKQITSPTLRPNTHQW